MLRQVINRLKTYPHNIQKVTNKRFYLLRNYCSLQNTEATHSETELKSNYPRENFRNKLLNGPHLKDFFKNEHLKDWENNEEYIPYLQDNNYKFKRKVFIEVYGCQMNTSDTEIILGILENHNFIKTDDIKEANVVLLVTCAIREGAEAKIWNRLKVLDAIKKKRSKKSSFKVGVLGCMAERLKEKLIEEEQVVDVVAGPDAYRDLPNLLALTENDQKSVNVLLSLDETYADVTPVRLNEDSISAFVSIMRGCDNMCTYCIVPFTRGRERSRPVDSIVREVDQLVEQGVKEITLLGQNVNSYRDISTASAALVPHTPTSLAKGFKTVYKPKIGGLRFSDLLHKIAEKHPELRIRFTSPHPKDFPDEVLYAIRDHPNICKSLHMPVQSGNSAVLERMRRGYTREAYLDLIEHIRSVIPNVAISSDFICGFCGETDEEFEDTVSLMNIVRYNTAYMFPYSMREKTTAHRRFQDDVPPEVKQKRLSKLIATFRHHAGNLNQAQVGQMQLVLIEGRSKRSEQQMAGRNDGNVKVIVPLEAVTDRSLKKSRELRPGDYVTVQINDSSSQVLKAIPLYRTTLQEFSENHAPTEYPDFDLDLEKPLPAFM